MKKFVEPVINFMITFLAPTFLVVIGILYFRISWYPPACEQCEDRPKKEIKVLCDWVEEHKSEASELMNQYREGNGLEPYEWNHNLYASALLSAKMIYDGDREWSHEGYTEIINQYYTGSIYAGENLARNKGEEITVFEDWKNSETHNEILLSEDACEYGFANYQNVYVLHTGCQ